jgi:hypothetical protein
VNGFCDYHTSSYFDLNPSEKTAREEEYFSPDYQGPEVFAVVPYHSGSGCTSGQAPNGISEVALDGGMVHEFAEMITDPYVELSWANEDPVERQEVADICHDGFWAFGNEAFQKKMEYGTPLGTAPNGALYNQVVDGRDYYYQQFYSDETESCRQRRGLPPAVTKLAPTKGSVAGAKTVKITGLNFQSPTVTGVDSAKFPLKASRSRRRARSPRSSPRPKKRVQCKSPSPPQPERAPAWPPTSSRTQRNSPTGRATAVLFVVQNDQPPRHSRPTSGRRR